MQELPLKSKVSLHEEPVQAQNFYFKHRCESGLLGDAHRENKLLYEATSRAL